MRAGYVYAHHSRDARECILPAITYHVSTCRRTLREFVVGNSWETEESYALKIQALGEVKRKVQASVLLFGAWNRKSRPQSGNPRPRKSRPRS